jgi:hypothetical protein
MRDKSASLIVITKRLRSIGDLISDGPIKQLVLEAVDEMDAILNNMDDSLQHREVVDRSVLKFKDMVINPLTKEMTMDGKTVKLPPREMDIIVKLARNRGKPVQFKIDSSHLTRISTLRRHFPKLKILIESLGKGEYILHPALKD